MRGPVIGQLKDKPKTPRTDRGYKEPKVQEPNSTRRGHAPRSLVIDRVRKAYEEIVVEEALEELGIDMSRRPPGMIPLEPFDDKNYDCRSPEEWLSLCKEAKLPAKALRYDDKGYGS